VLIVPGRVSSLLPAVRSNNPAYFDASRRRSRFPQDSRCRPEHQPHRPLTNIVRYRSSGFFHQPAGWCRLYASGSPTRQRAPSFSRLRKSRKLSGVKARCSMIANAERVAQRQRHRSDVVGTTRRCRKPWQSCIKSDNVGLRCE
jgi:hypothetical protein